MRSLLAFALAACGSSSAQVAPVIAPVLDCPAGTTLRRENTVEGPNTWLVCRDARSRAHGPSRMSYADGKRRNAGAYLAGDADGPWTSWDRDGRVESSGVYRRGKRDGRWEWHSSTDSRVEQFRDGVLTGPYRRVFANGRPAEVGAYDAGAKVGTWLTYHPIGTLASEEPYVADRLHGTRRAFHAGGTLAGVHAYRDGELDGHARSFHENGTRSSEGTFTAGKATGRWIHWHPDGRISAEGEMIDNQRHGDWTLDGRVVHFERGREGRLRPCPTGSVERTGCVARCCDVSARWCERPDGTKVGPYDAWDVHGLLVQRRP